MDLTLKYYKGQVDILLQGHFLISNFVLLLLHFFSFYFQCYKTKLFHLRSK